MFNYETLKESAHALQRATNDVLSEYGLQADAFDSIEGTQRTSNNVVALYGRTQPDRNFLPFDGVRATIIQPPTTIYEARNTFPVKRDVTRKIDNGRTTIRVETFYPHQPLHETLANDDYAEEIRSEGSHPQRSIRRTTFVYAANGVSSLVNGTLITTSDGQIIEDKRKFIELARIPTRELIIYHTATAINTINAAANLFQRMALRDPGIEIKIKGGR